MKTRIVIKENGKIIKKPIDVDDAIKMYVKDPNEIYSDVFFEKRAKKDNEWKRKFGTYLLSLYNIGSVVDLGCGTGEFLEGFLNSGVKDLRGFEYSYKSARKYIEPSIAEFITYGNVMEKIDCKQFDLVISIEVAEHILPEKSEVFIKNLTSLSSKYILLTAAPPGQGGMGHINEREHEYWIEKIEDCGFKFNKEASKNIEDGFGGSFSNNLLFFIKE